MWLLTYGVVLVFIGAKMGLIDVYNVPVGVSLGVVATILAVTMLLSIRISRRLPVLLNLAKATAGGPCQR